MVAHEVLGRSPLFGLKTPEQMFQAAARLNLEAELSRKCRRVRWSRVRRLAATRHLFLNTHPAELQNVDVLIMSMQEMREALPRQHHAGDPRSGRHVHDGCGIFAP